MKLLEKLTKRAQKIYPRILLPESTDQRVIQAAISISTQKIAKIVLLGNEDEICSQLDQSSENKKHNLEFINPKDEKLRNDYAKTLFERRKHKGLELNESLDLVSNPTVFAMLALQRDEVDGVVTGAITPSQQVLGNALRIIGVSNNSKLVSSFFLMMFDQNHHNYGQNMIFSDCAMNIDPTAEELAEIAQSAFKSAKSLDIKPKIAMLSFSTNRSTQYSQVEKVRLATSICETKLPDIDIVGNIQLDAALERRCYRQNILKQLLSLLLIFLSSQTWMLQILAISLFNDFQVLKPLGQSFKGWLNQSTIYQEVAVLMRYLIQ